MKLRMRLFERWLFCCLAIGIALIGGVGCSGGGGNIGSTGGNGNPGVNAQVRPLLISVNPADNFLARVVNSDGTVVTYQGTKNAEGFPTSITGAVIESGGASPQRIVVTYDSQGRPSSAVTESRGGISFQYLSSNLINIAIQSPDGSSNGLISYDPTTGQVLSGGASPSKSANRFNAPATTTRATTSDTVTGHINVTAGGTPFTPDLIIGTFRPDQGPVANIGFALLVSAQSEGSYTYQVPKHPFAPSQSDVAKFLNLLKPILDHICTVTQDTGGPKIDDNLKKAIALAAVRLGPLAPVAVETSITAILAACTGYGTLTALQNVADKIQTTDLFAASGSIEITAITSSDTGEKTVTSKKAYVGFGTAVPDFTLAFPEDVRKNKKFAGIYQGTVVNNGATITGTLTIDQNLNLKFDAISNFNIPVNYSGSITPAGALSATGVDIQPSGIRRFGFVSTLTLTGNQLTGHGNETSLDGQGADSPDTYTFTRSSGGARVVVPLSRPSTGNSVRKSGRSVLGVPTS